MLSSDAEREVIHGDHPKTYFLNEELAISQKLFFIFELAAAPSWKALLV